MNAFGSMIKKLREQKSLPLRIVAAHLDIDQAILSKIERGQRKAQKELVVKLAEFFEVDENKLMVTWLADKILYEVQDEEMAAKAIQLAEKNIIYQSGKSIKEKNADHHKNQILSMQSFFRGQNIISKVWIFGRFARNENDNTDIELIIDVPQSQVFTLFDMIEMQTNLQELLQQKVNLMMLHALTLEFKRSIKNEMKLIYEA